MKNINFINTVADKKQLEIRKWYKISCWLFFLILLIILFLQFKLIHHQNFLKKEKSVLEQSVADFDNIVKQKEKLKEDQKFIQNKLENLQKISENNSLDNYFIGIAHAIPNEAYLDNLEYNKKEIMLKGYCSDSQCIIKFIEKLSKLAFVDKVKLEYVKTNEQKLSAKEENSNFLHEFCIKLNLKK